MKKIYYLPLAAIAFCGIGLNLHLNLSRSKSGSLTIANISAVQSSAGEAYCAPVNQNVCTIHLSDGTSGTGVGNFTYVN